MKTQLLFKLLLVGILLSVLTNANAQFRHESIHGTYYPVEDPLVIEKMEQWQDVKFGLMMHWGTYSQWGIVESWTLCPEDEGWCQRPDGSSYYEYKNSYEALQTTFNPVDFNPDKWADAADRAGMKYVIFTTKHHDGFCMFDSKYTDYKITGEKTPFHTNPKANVTNEIFKAFRAKDFMIGTYFSKPDWNVPSYWWPYFPVKDRNVNYDVTTYPERWEEYVQFTHNQIDELMTDYGDIDILWFDGGWVCKYDSEEEATNLRNSTGLKQPNLQNQDIRMNEISANARKKQPGIIVVDRAVDGPNQNYMTPENKVPTEYIPIPWESNIISGGGYSYTPNATYMSSKKVVQMLVDIVAKGGNLVLNIAPSPKGDFDPAAYTMLSGVADWMEVNSSAIYETRPIAPYREGQLAFTQNRKTKSVYVTYLPSKDEDKMVQSVTLNNMVPSKGAKVTILGSKTSLKWKVSGTGSVISIPKKLISKLGKSEAYVIQISSVK